MQWGFFFSRIIAFRVTAKLSFYVFYKGVIIILLIFLLYAIVFRFNKEF